MAVDRNTNYSIADVLGTTQSGGVDENIFGEDTLDPTNTLLLGKTARTSTQYGRTATVKAGEDIRPALESLKSAGGGTLILLAGVHQPTYDIVGDSKINILGQGTDITVIDFQNNNNQIKFVGTSSSLVENFFIQGLTIKNSNATNAVFIDYCSYFNIIDVVIQNCNSVGLLIDRAQSYRIINTSSNNNGSHGVLLQETSGRQHEEAYFEYIKADSNGGDGIKVDNGVTRIVFVAPYPTDNDGNGLNILGGTITIIGRNGSGNGVVSGVNLALDSSSVGVVDIGSIASNVVNPGDTRNIITAGAASGFTSRRDIINLGNYSGSTINAGEVVVYDLSNSDTRRITTTTTQGDDFVCGIALQSINNTSSGSILLEGTTTLLKVNGTTAISVGDFLGTYTSAGIAMKAASGDMAFAIALEAYSTADSNGVIDALLIKPRKI